MLQEILNALKEIIVPITISEVAVTRTIAAAGDYAAEDVMSNSASAGTVWRFPNVARKNGGSAEIINAQVLWETTALTPRITLFLFTQPPTCVLNDNVANTAVANADIPFYIGKIDFPALEDLGGVSETEASPSTVGNLPKYFTCHSGSHTLYGVVVTRDAVTGESAGKEMTIKLTSERF